MSPTKIKIIEFLKTNPETSVIRLLDEFDISKQAMHKHLKELIEKKEIEKKGLPPRVYYSINVLQEFPNLDISDRHILDDFVVITSSGDKYEGQKAFVYWCEQRNFNTVKYLEIYKNIKTQYSKYRNNLNLIDASEKVKSTFGEDCFIDSCYYNSFSAIEIFGRTGIYAQMLYAKQSSNKVNMKELFPEIIIDIQKIIKSLKVDAIGFVPPTIPRKVQLMSELEKTLKLNLLKLVIKKIKNQYIVPQKTLSKPTERKENAQKTFVVEYVPK